MGAQLGAPKRAPSGVRLRAPLRAPLGAPPGVPFGSSLFLVGSCWAWLAVILLNLVGTGWSCLDINGPGLLWVGLVGYGWISLDLAGWEKPMFIHSQPGNGYPSAENMIPACANVCGGNGFHSFLTEKLHLQATKAYVDIINSFC